jgi:hypothetical protein
MGTNHPVRGMRRGSNLFLRETTKTNVGSWKIKVLSMVLKVRLNHTYCLPSDFLDRNSSMAKPSHLLNSSFSHAL